MIGRRRAQAHRSLMGLRNCHTLAPNIGANSLNDPARHQHFPRPVYAVPGDSSDGQMRTPARSTSASADPPRRSSSDPVNTTVCCGFRSDCLPRLRSPGAWLKIKCGDFLMQCGVNLDLARLSNCGIFARLWHGLSYLLSQPGPKYGGPRIPRENPICPTDPRGPSEAREPLIHASITAAHWARDGSVPGPL